MARGMHLLVDCRGVAEDVCLDDERMLNTMAAAARKAGATVLSQTRYHFGHNSPAGFTAAVMLDESHCTAHAYADEGLLAIDIFTCGHTNPHQVLAYMQQHLDLGQVTVREAARFDAADDSRQNESPSDAVLSPGP